MNTNASMVSDHDFHAAAPMRGGSRNISAIRHFVDVVGRIRRVIAARHNARLTAAQLSRLDDSILKDIGISRGEVLGLAEDLASGRTDGTRPIRYRSETYRPVGE